jgi:hypothetical protein
VPSTNPMDDMERTRLQILGDPSLMAQLRQVSNDSIKTMLFVLIRIHRMTLYVGTPSTRCDLILQMQS